MQTVTGRTFFEEYQRAYRRKAIERGVTRVLGAACALIVLAVVGMITLEILDQEVGPFGAPFSVNVDG